jgi:tetratricopeptide (TPR) repeat protein
MKLFKITIFIIFVGVTVTNTAQVNSIIYEKITKSLNDSDLVYFNKGVQKFDQEFYLDAIKFFEKVQNQDIALFNYIKGICYCYDANSTAKGLENILRVKAEADKIEGYYFNLGFAYEKNDSINAAIENYKISLAIHQSKVVKPLELINELNYRLNRCKLISDYINKINVVRIKNIGKPINTDASEYCPLITSNESMMIFTYRGPKSKGGKQKLKSAESHKVENLELYFEDIYKSEKINDSTWSEPKAIDKLNTHLHDAAVSLNFDGTQLLIYRNNGPGSGDLFFSKLEGNEFSQPVWQGGLNSNEWDGSACFLPQKNKVIFASERKGGFGGKDLYVAEKIKDNVWGNIKNLGPEINTKYDEDAPFVTVDGKILFFSSNNHQSIGGYDIFRSDLKNDAWQTPYNLGQPINTSNDDKFFTVRADGKVGYYSTFKKGGKGEQDIYMVEPGIPGKPVELLELNGSVTIDGKPSNAEIKIKSIIENKLFNLDLNCNNNKGTFFANLPAGLKYEIKIKAGSFPEKIIELSTVNVDSFVVLNVFAEFNSSDFSKKANVLNKRFNDSINLKETIFNNEIFGSQFGDSKKEGLKFKVQIGAYKFFENFNYNNILGFPIIIRQTDNDYITRFVMGSFETYNQALELLKKVKTTKELKDCFIIANYKGEKKYLSQLISEKILE